jgi:tetratricopeptide (TPR) repeat protein
MEVQDKIDAYVKNEMPPDERAAFEAELLQDTALQEAVQQARLDLDVANRLIETEILGWMQDWEPESATADAGANRSPLRVSASNVRKYWMAAAAALALVAAAVWFFIRPSTPESPGIVQPVVKPAAPAPGPVAEDVTKETTPTPEKRPPAADSRLIALAESKFRGREPRTFVRGATPGQSTKDALSQAAEAFEAKNIRSALRLAMSVPASDERYADAQLFLGQVYFSQKQFEKAERAFRAALATGNIGADEAEWNILLCLLAQYPAKKADFDALSAKISDDAGDHIFKEEAKQLREQMK